jgi:hypothetical protein
VSQLVLILDGTPEGPEIASAMREAGHLVMHARPEDGAALAGHRRPALVVLDADAPGALALCGILRSGPEAQSLPIVLVGQSGLTLHSTADAIVRGGDAFFPRPVDRARLHQKIRTLLGGGAAAAPVGSTVMPAVATSVAPRERTFVLGDDATAAAAPAREPTFVLPAEKVGTPAVEPAASGRPTLEAPPPPAVAAVIASAPPGSTEPSTPRPSVMPPAPRPSGPPSPRPSVPPGAPEPDLPLSTELRRVLSDVEQRLFPDSPALSFHGLPSEEDLESFLPPELAEDLGADVAEEDDGSVDTFAGAFETESFQLDGGTDVSVVVPKDLAEPGRGAPASEALWGGQAPEQTGVVASSPDTPARPARTEPVPPPAPRRPDAEAMMGMGDMPTGLAPLAPEPGFLGRVTPPGPLPAFTVDQGSPAIEDDGASTSPGEGDVPDALLLRVHGRALRSGELHETDLPQLLAAAWAGRLSGRLRLRRGDAEKILHLVEGQVVLATSNLVEDRLVEVLWREGRIPRDQFEQVRAMIAGSGRRAGAILVERGVLRHEELFPLVRHHFEGIVWSVFAWEQGHWSVEPGAPPSGEQILIDQPTPALIVEGVRRKLSPDMLAKRLGGPSTVLRARPVGLCPLELVALLPEEERALADCDGVRPLAQIAPTGAELDVGAALYGLLVLGLVEVATMGRDEPGGAFGREELGALRSLEVDRARWLERLRGARTGDYFAVLGLTRGATGYEVRRAYLELRRELHRRDAPVPEDLVPVLAELAEMVDEAYEVLRDPELRSSYLAHLP